MKKAYLIPETSVEIVGFQLMDTTMSVPGGTTGNNGITGGDAKSRADEEEEAAYLSGSGSADSYGNLW